MELSPQAEEGQLEGGDQAGSPQHLPGSAPTLAWGLPDPLTQNCSPRPEGPTQDSPALWPSGPSHSEAPVLGVNPQVCPNGRRQA